MLSSVDATLAAASALDVTIVVSTFTLAAETVVETDVAIGTMAIMLASKAA